MCFWVFIVVSNFASLPITTMLVYFKLKSSLPISCDTVLCSTFLLLQVCENFDDMALREELLRGIYAYGFEKPSAIQQRAIVPCVKGLDVIAQAQSGTGKTATFSISILQQIDTSKPQCQALILAPTRELAQQIQKVNLYSPVLSAVLLTCTGSVTSTLIFIHSGGHGAWRLHGRPVPRLHRRDLRQRGHEETGCRTAHCCR